MANFEITRQPGFENWPNGPDYTSERIEFLYDSEIAANRITWTGAAAPANVNDDRHGSVTITTSGADNSYVQAQFNREVVRFESGKKVYLLSRQKVSDVLQTDLAVGWVKRTAEMLSGAAAFASDGVWVRKDDGDAQLDVAVAYNATAEADYTGSNNFYSALVNDTYFWLGLLIAPDGAVANRGLITTYVNGTVYGSPISSALVMDEELALTFGLRAGEAAVKSATFDSFIYGIEK